MEQRKVPVTREGLERLKEEVQHLKEVRRPEIAAIVAEARSHGDLRENAAYDVARIDQAMLERRIKELEELVKSAVIMDDMPKISDGTVRVGSTVFVDFEGEEERYVIVGAIEAKPAEGKISNESPLGKALMGKKAGTRVEVAAPHGSHHLTILRVE